MRATKKYRHAFLNHSWKVWRGATSGLGNICLMELPAGKILGFRMKMGMFRERAWIPLLAFKVVLHANTRCLTTLLHWAPLRTESWQYRPRYYILPVIQVGENVDMNVNTYQLPQLPLELLGIFSPLSCETAGMLKRCKCSPSKGPRFHHLYSG